MELRKIVGIKVSDPVYDHEILSANGGDIHQAIIIFRSFHRETGTLYEGRENNTLWANGVNITDEDDARAAYRTMALDAVVGEVFEDDDCYAHNYSYVDNQAFRL